MHKVSDAQRLLRLPEVRGMTGLGPTKIYELEKQGKFPRRVKMSRISTWVESEVQQFVAARIAERDSNASAA